MPHVLVVEDLEVNQHLARKLLERLGCIVDVAIDGRAALEMTSRTHYDLIFMDVQMPDMDGLAVTRAIRARAGPCHRVPIVAMTANALPQHRLECLAAGMNDYMTKPLVSDLLRAMIERYATNVAQRTGDETLAPSDTFASEDAAGSEVGALTARPDADTCAESVPILDPQRIEVLVDLAKLRVDAFDPVITLYARNVHAKLAELRTAIAARDLAALGSAAHAIKGSALNVGANRVVILARALERGAVEGDPRALEADCGAIDRAFEESVRALRARADNVAHLGAAAIADPP